ncbi:hypothetical protein ACWDT6_19805 [Nocardia grenadensis]
MESLPELNTPPPRRLWRYLRAGLKALKWAPTALNVVALLSGNDTASPAISAITELAVWMLAAIMGVGT